MAKISKNQELDLNLSDRTVIAMETGLTQRLAISLAADEDPVTAAEQAAEVGRNELDPKTELALAIRYNQMKTDKAEWNEDTYHGMSWGYFHNVLKKQGFEQVYAHDFKDSRSDNTEEFNVWVKRDKGYLVSADSYSEKSIINSANLYYELALPDSYDNLTEIQHDSISRLRGSRSPLLVDGSIAASLFYLIDARRELVRNLREVEESTLSTNVPWKNALPSQLHFLQLYDFADAKVNETDNFIETLKNRDFADFSFVSGQNLDHFKVPKIILNRFSKFSIVNFI